MNNGKIYIVTKETRRTRFIQEVRDYLDGKALYNEEEARLFDEANDLLLDEEE